MAILQISRPQLDILRDARENLIQSVGISADNPTSTVLTMLKSMSQEVSSMWNYMNTLLTKGFITTAFGDSLDEIGVLLQESRSGNKRAMDLSATNVKFYMDESYAQNITDLLTRYLTIGDRNKLLSINAIDDLNNPSLINIPANVVISTADGSIAYKTMNPIVLSNTQSWDYTPVIANDSGSQYNVSPNTLVNHNIVSIYPVFAKIINAIRVTNTYGIRNGSSIENDENYRFRLSNKAVSAVSGNETSIRKAVLSVPDVVDVSLIPRTHGNGTFTIFPQTVDPILSDGVMLACKTAVTNVAAIGFVAYVEAPMYYAVAFNIQLRFAPGADKNSIFANARLVVMDYINNLPLGGEIVINEIIQRVMSIDNNIIDMSIPAFGFGNYNRQTGAITNYMPLRLMNQRADWNQKWYTNSNMCTLCEAGTQ